MSTFEEVGPFAAHALLGGGEASDADYVVIRTHAELERLCDEIFDEREAPIVGLTLRGDSHEPVLRASDVRGVVGPGVRIYLIASEEHLQGLRGMVGSRLSIWLGAIRVWWPGASVCDDPGDHPLIMGLEDEDYLVTLEEFADEFDLARPRVRPRVRLIEDARAFLERELSSAREETAGTRERLRDAQILCHELRARAEVAEAGLAAARRSVSG